MSKYISPVCLVIAIACLAFVILIPINQKITLSPIPTSHSPPPPK